MGGGSLGPTGHRPHPHMTQTTQTTRTANHPTDPQHDDPAANRPMSVPDIQSTYNTYADWIHRFEPLDRLMTGRYRRTQFSNLNGTILDIACGTGTNFRYLPETTHVIGIDISPAMLTKAETRLTQLDLTGTLHEMDAQTLAFPTNSFKTVISALSTCTFPDPVAALNEMARVCTPDGQIRLLEHGQSNISLLARYQKYRADATSAKAGCRVTQLPYRSLIRPTSPSRQPLRANSDESLPSPRNPRQETPNIRDPPRKYNDG